MTPKGFRARRLGQFDADMRRVLRYHRKLVKLCRIYVAIQADGELFARTDEGAA
jgi:hypothetical protein